MLYLYNNIPDYYFCMSRNNNKIGEDVIKKSNFFNHMITPINLMIVIFFNSNSKFIINLKRGELNQITGTI